jgi:hypothetical protein
MLTRPDDRIGQAHLEVDPAKVIAVVPTDQRDSESALAAPDAVSEAIAGHVVDFFRHEVARGRLPEGSLLPLQAGIGNVANAVLAGLSRRGPFSELTCYSEVIQDSMLRLIREGKVAHASATSLALSGQGLVELVGNIDLYRRHITLRPQEISNHPEIVRRLGVIGMNGMLEADVYGNVNSTHVGGTRIMNGIGGSGGLHPQRLRVDVPQPVHGQERLDLGDRADGPARRPHRARRAGDRHRTRAGGPAWAEPPQEVRRDRGPVRGPVLPAAPARLPRSGAGPARRGSHAAYPR